MNTELLIPLQGKEAPVQPIDLEALALHLEAIRGRIVLYMCPHDIGRTEAEQRRHVLQAEAYKMCAASLMAAASAIRTMGPQKKREQHQKPMELDGCLTNL